MVGSPGVLRALMDISGTSYACVLERDSGRVLDDARSNPQEVVDTNAVGRWARAATALVDGPDGPPDRPADTIDDLIVSSRAYYHVLRPIEVPGGPVLLVYVRLQRGRANLALARHEIAAATVTAGVVALAGGPVTSPAEPVPAAVPAPRRVARDGLEPALSALGRAPDMSAPDPQPDLAAPGSTAPRSQPGATWTGTYTQVNRSGEQRTGPPDVIPRQARSRPSPPAAMAGRSMPLRAGSQVSSVAVPPPVDRSAGWPAATSATGRTTTEPRPDRAGAAGLAGVPAQGGPTAVEGGPTLAAPGAAVGDRSATALPRRAPGSPVPPAAPPPRGSTAARDGGPGRGGAWAHDVSTMKRLLAGLRRLV